MFSCMCPSNMFPFLCCVAYPYDRKDSQDEELLWMKFQLRDEQLSDNKSAVVMRIAKETHHLKDLNYSEISRLMDTYASMAR